MSSEPINLIDFNDLNQKIATKRSKIMKQIDTLKILKLNIIIIILRKFNKVI
jgi:hypothetical protein